MADLAVIVPTRGRPERMLELLDAIAANSRTDVMVYVGTDDDDPALDDYVAMISDHDVPIYHAIEPRKTLSAWTNQLAERAMKSSAYLASLGDDHRPRTDGWDEQLISAIEALDGPGFAYGNDLLQGRHLPTAWVVSSVVVEALGWMMLPTCDHMYVDNAIREVGQAAGRLAYLPGVVVEHVHPRAGKVAWDETYLATNHTTQYAYDLEAFKAWRAGQMLKDAATLSALQFD